MIKKGEIFEVGELLVRLNCRSTFIGGQLERYSQILICRLTGNPDFVEIGKFEVDGGELCT